MNLSRLDYEKSKNELEEMEREISASVDNTDVPFINATAEKDLQVKTFVRFDNLDDGEFAKINIKLLASIPLEQLQIVIMNNPAFVVPQSIFFFNDFKAQEKETIETTIYSSESDISEIFSGEIVIMISFINKQGIARVLKKNLEIPLEKIVRKNNAQKDGTFKVVLIKNNLMDLLVLLKGLFDSIKI
jgi:hypothetical protein